MGKSEHLATSLSGSDLSWTEGKTKPVEYVAAMSAATRLGSDIFRAADHDAHAMRRAVLQLMSLAARELGRKKINITSGLSQTMAAAAIIELIHPYCITCGGAREIMGEKIKVICPTCSGIGVRRYTDSERAKMVGIKPEDWHKHELRYRVFIEIASQHYVAAPISALKHLG